MKGNFMYQLDSRVRFSETDTDRRLTLDAMVDYFQDCSTFQTEDLGVGFSYLLPQKLTWIVSYWHIIVEEYPALGERISVGTKPYNFKGFLGKRNFLMEKEGKCIVKADSLWVLMDTEKQVPARVPEKVEKAYPKEEKLEMEYLPRKIAIAGKEEIGDPFVIQKHHLDCNGHVNNGQYIKLALAHLPEGYTVRQLRAEYKKQAHLGDVMVPYLYREEARRIVCLCDETGIPYAVMEFEENVN